MIESIDDMFIFLTQHLSSLRTTTIKTMIVKPPKEEDEIMDGQEETLELQEAQLTGSSIDKFLRRCLIASGQMMFEQISTLYQQYMLFKQE